MPSKNPIEAARRLKGKGKSSRAIAKRLSRSHSSVAQTLALLKLSLPVQEMVRSGEITKTHARTLTTLPASEQLRYANLSVTERLSVRALQQAIKGAESHQVSSDTARLERRISERLATPVSIDERRRVIAIKYHNLDILEGILEKIGCLECDWA